MRYSDETLLRLWNMATARFRSHQRWTPFYGSLLRTLSEHGLDLIGTASGEEE